MESEVAEESQANLEERIERMREGNPPVTRDLKPNELNKIFRLQEELVMAKERLRLSEEEVFDVHRQLEQSKETLRELETQVMTLEFESKICQGTLREAQVKHKMLSMTVRSSLPQRTNSCAYAKRSRSRRWPGPRSRNVLKPNSYARRYRSA
jgi:hypothetical protein